MIQAAVVSARPIAFAGKSEEFLAPHIHSAA
jgi:hypothetical protein